MPETAPNATDLATESSAIDKMSITKFAMIMKVADDKVKYLENALQFKFINKEHVKTLNANGFTIVPNYDFVSMASCHYLITHNILNISNDTVNELLDELHATSNTTDSTTKSRTKNVTEIRELAMISEIANNNAKYFKNALQFVDKEDLLKLKEYGYTVVPNYDLGYMACFRYLITHDIFGISDHIINDLLSE